MRGTVAVASAGAVLLLFLVAAVGFIVGEDVTERRHDLGGWMTGVGKTNGSTVSVQHDDWYYAAEGAVDQWIDQRGRWRDSGWPTCLAGGVAMVEVRFAAHEVSLEGTTWRTIVAVDCRGTTKLPE